jgi:hypothetical protein
MSTETTNPNQGPTMFVAYIVSKGTKYLYEGSVNEQAIWTPESKSKPKQMTENEAYTIAIACAEKGETPGIEEV